MAHAAEPPFVHDRVARIGVLLVNLGTPEAPTPSAVRRYLDKFGWRSAMWFELTNPTWVEDATPLFALIQRYFADPAVDPRLANARAAARRRPER